MNGIRLTLLALVTSVAIFAQTYEVASVKLNNSASGSTSSHSSKGQIVIINMTLKSLIESAYQVKPFQVSGPDWLESVHADITAKFPPDTKPKDHAPMLRALLEDRFKLSIHRKSQEMSGFALVVAKGGFKLKPVPEASGAGTSSSGGRIRKLEAKRLSLPQIADMLALYVKELVVDQTGITGFYDFTLRWTDEDQKPNDPEADTAPSIYTAIQEVLGLRLKPEKVPGEIIVVDHIERAPIEN